MASHDCLPADFDLKRMILVVVLQHGPAVTSKLNGLQQVCRLRTSKGQDKEADGGDPLVELI